MVDRAGDERGHRNEKLTGIAPGLDQSGGFGRAGNSPGIWVDEAEFRTAMRHVAASVSVITARSGGERNGLTATAVCSVSADPATMLVCVNRSASAERLIAGSGAFAINFLTEAQHPVARLFSTARLPGEQRFSEGAWGDMTTGAPVLEGALAVFDCEVERCITVETHNLYVGRVVATRFQEAEGLLYRDGAFRRLAPAG